LKKRFQAELMEGHKGILAVLVPFNPEVAFRRKPTRLAGRRHGWPVRGTARGVAFDGYIGERWGRFFIALDERVCSDAGIGVGDVVAVSVTPSAEASVVAAAVQQSRKTTQPSKARPDALPSAHPAMRRG